MSGTLDPRRRAAIVTAVASGHAPTRRQAAIGAVPPGTTTSPTPRERRQQRPPSRRLVLDTPEPWPSRVDGATLAAAMREAVLRHVALPPHAATAVVLWALHAYNLDGLRVSPLLAITSPVMRCGKTTLLTVVGALTPRPLITSNISPAAVFRLIETYQPTLLIDEADSFLGEREELRGLLNAGHTRETAFVARCVGDTHDVRLFSVWCPKVVALIGALPTTLRDRSIEIRMRRRTPDERIAPLRCGRIFDAHADLRRQAARWTADYKAQIEACDDPALPAELGDRAADCWRPLVAIADQLGGSWPDFARAAAVALSGAGDGDPADYRLELLRDIAELTDDDRDFWPSEQLVEQLRALPDRPWATWGRTGRGLTAHALARALREFDIYATSTGAQRGYRVAAFREAWRRYLPAKVSKRQNANNDGPESTFAKCQAALPTDTLQSVKTPINIGSSDALTLSAPPAMTGEPVRACAACGGPAPARQRYCRPSCRERAEGVTPQPSGLPFGGAAWEGEL